jgi:pSer/pThr/pTyr-binding forkhead associated (FHA) protein
MAAPPPTFARVPPTPAPAPRVSSSEATQYVRIGAAAPQGLVAILAGIEGPLEGEIFKIRDGDNTMGRENCDVLLPSRRISRFHARLKHEDGVFVIEANPEVFDKNPTVLNGAEIEADGLSDGDTLKLGDCTFRFRTI